MCGVAGIFLRDGLRRPEESDLMRMASMMRHRGPDGVGVYIGPGAGLAISRLSIIDLAGGWQPIPNEDGTVWVACNGEIFNYIELRAGLEARGHRFRTASDIEVLVHLFEDLGIRGLLEELNGQFAFCLYDRKAGKFFLARDRVGIHPLHYAVRDDRIVFASEAKAILSFPAIAREIDPVALDQIYTFWATLPGRTIFRGIREVPAGHYLEHEPARWDDPAVRPYWECTFSSDRKMPTEGIEENSRQLLSLLKDATRIRLRSDVPVGAYLSGGLDSSSVAALIVRHMDSQVETFSIGFEDKGFDESAYQAQVVERLQVKHRRVICSYDDIAEATPKVIWHSERPLIRTAAVPMFLLSSLVHRAGYRVVLTGEGADEFLGGYDLFKEALIRSFWKRAPDSKWRPMLLKKLYPYLRQSPSRADSYMKSFFGKGLSDDDPVLFSHRTRWETTSAIKTFFSEDFKAPTPIETHLEGLRDLLPSSFGDWHPLQQAQDLEILLLLPQYLLSSQGDRVAMAHSVEARYPFLDPNVIDFANRLPPGHKISGLNEKAVLKRAMKGYLPESVLKRAKQPYMAPDSDTFFKGSVGREIVDEYLSTANVRKAGIFEPEKVRFLVEKCRAGRAIGFRDNMAFVGILTAQIFSRLFLESFQRAAPCGKPHLRFIQERSGDFSTEMAGVTAA
jgi:asparagine synthase (glutamine-hydrolysing)